MLEIEKVVMGSSPEPRCRGELGGTVFKPATTGHPKPGEWIKPSEALHE
jgi:hypothetical protein